MRRFAAYTCSCCTSCRHDTQTSRESCSLHLYISCAQHYASTVRRTCRVYTCDLIQVYSIQLLYVLKFA